MTANMKENRIIMVLTSLLMLQYASGVALPLQVTMALNANKEIPTWDQLISDAYDDVLYRELKKYHQPNYLAKWPGLRDLLFTAADYDGDNANFESANEVANSRFLERLAQLAAVSSNIHDLENIREEQKQQSQSPSQSQSQSQPLQYTSNSIENEASSSEMLSLANDSKQTSNFKEQGTKKNVQFRKHYMSPCHFKICNMGRKRNARYLTKA